MKTIVANGRISREGRLKISANEQPMFLEQISRLPGRTCTVKVIIDGKKRSREQNNYYHGVVVKMFQLAIMDMWGENITTEAVHEFLKQNCNYRELVNSSTGETIKVGKTTTDLTTTEFEEYCERCRMLASEYFGMYIPAPNEQIDIEF